MTAIDRHFYSKVLSFDKGCFWVRDPDCKFKGQLSGFSYIPNMGRWVTTDIKTANSLHEFADPQCKAILSRYYIRKIKELSEPKEGVNFPKGLNPFKFQLEAVKFAASRNRSYLALDPGMGKTPISAMCINSFPGSSLIVCPSFLKRNWKEEILKWNTLSYQDHHIQIINSYKDAEKISPETPVIIYPDSLLASDKAIKLVRNLKRDWLFVDEAHRYKNPQAKRTVALIGGPVNEKGKIIGYTRGLERNASQVVLLSGSPMPNRPMELWSVLFSQCAGEIDFLNQKDFGFKFCDGFFDEDVCAYNFRGASNLPELFSKVMGKYMLRMEKHDYLDLPEKTREIIYLEDAKIDKETEKLNKNLSINFDMSDLLDQLGRDDFELGDWARIRRENGLAKIMEAGRFISDILDSTEEKILVFAHHRDVIDDLASDLQSHGVLKIYGGMDSDEKHFAAKKFQEDPKTRVLILNLEAGGVGLNLTAANRVIFAEFDPVPEVNRQAEDRAHRIGQKDIVLCQYLALPKTIDELILKIVVKKMDTIDQLNQAKGA